MSQAAATDGVSRLRKVVLNAIWLALGGLVAQGCFVAIDALIARELGPQQYGIFGTVYSLSLGLVYLVEAGANSRLIEVGSKRAEEIPWLMGTAMGLRLILFILWYPVLVFALGAFGYSTDVVQFFALFFFYPLLLMMHDTLAASYAARQRMHVNALFQSASPVAILLLVLLVPLDQWQLAGAGAAYLCGVFLVTAVWFTLVWREHRPELRLRSMPGLLKGSAVYGVAGLLDQLGQRIDILIVSMLRPMSEVGLYVAAHRIFEVCMKAGVVASRAVIPMLFKVNAEDMRLFARLCDVALRLFAIAGASLGLFIALAAEPLIGMIFGARYAAAALVLQVLGIALALRFIGLGLEAVLMASSHKVKRAASLGASVTMNATLSLLLVPQVGIAGAAVARFCGGIAHLAFSLGGANVPLPLRRVVLLIGWPMICAAGSFVFVGTLGLPAIPRIALGVVLLPLLLLATRYVRVSEVRQVIRPGAQAE